MKSHSSERMLHKPSTYFLPLDSRPVCYQALKNLAEITGVEHHLPPKHLLGSYDQFPKLYELYAQFYLISPTPPEIAILATDMAIYGGLIPSRRNHDEVTMLHERVDALYHIFSKQTRYAYSSILRIPNYNNDEEEPEYWKRYGKSLYDFSVRSHQAFLGTQDPSEQNTAIEEPIPEAVLQDFLKRRKRNFENNQNLLTDCEKGLYHYLVFCEDDRGEYGLNVQEAHSLQRLISEKHLTHKAHVQTGADEVAHTLFIRALHEANSMKPKIYIACQQNFQAYCLFDGQALEKVIHQRLQACLLELVNDPHEADVLAIVHAPHHIMGDHCGGHLSDTTLLDAQNTLASITELLELNKPLALLDVAYANGGDPLLLKTIKEESPFILPKLSAYSAWNTPGNALGSGLALLCAVHFALAYEGGGNKAQEKARQEALMLHFLDDGMYQAVVRQHLRAIEQDSSVTLAMPNPLALNEAMYIAGQWIFEVFKRPFEDLKFTFPCNRYFEIEVEFS